MEFTVSLVLALIAAGIVIITIVILTVLLRKTRRQLEETTKSKADILYNLSHGIRTTLNTIIGFTEMARDSIDDPERLENYLGKLHQAGESMQEIIDEIPGTNVLERKVSKKDVGPKIRVNRTPKAAKAETEEKGEEERETITFDLNQPDDNNFENDYLGPGAIELLANKKAGKTEKSPEKAPEKEENKIEEIVFEKEEISVEKPVRRVEKDDAVSETKNIVQKTLDNKASEKPKETKKPEKKDTTPERTTPRLTEPPKTAYATIVSSPGPTINFDFEGKRVLLVEDNELNREYAKYVLTEDKFDVVTANNGAVAVRLVKEKGPDYFDVILMDVQMPVMDGHEATTTIRNMFPDAKLPIIALSANAFEEDREASLEAGMNDHIAKPIDTVELATVLSKFL